MPDADKALSTLNVIRTEFAAFCDAHGSVTEADTRVKVIDRVLREVCEWPEADITREEHTERGYMDYCLSVQGRRFIAVEAKKEGVPFVLPHDMAHRSLKLSGALITDTKVRDAITQVRGYCDDAGVRYAIATNGYAWIVFRAIREDIPWRDGSARIFPSLEYIRDNFTEFWNLLSYNAISAGSLDNEFGTPHRATRKLLRVVDTLYNSDLPLERNRYDSQLQPLIKAIFEDIADQVQLEILQSCYVYSKSLHVVARDLDCVIVDAVPKFLKNQGTETIEQGRTDAGQFGTAISSALISDKGELFLLLGGIGSGKTTFLKRYQRSVGRETLDKNALWFHVDFLAAPTDAKEIEVFVWKNVLDQIRARYDHLKLEERAKIKKAFEAEIAVLNETSLKYIKQGTKDYEKALSPYLESWQSNTSEYVPRLLRTSKSKVELSVVIFIDNVDQLPPAYQAQIFLLAQRVTRTIGSITIISLREESYYTASIQKAFTAYMNRKFHIASPNFRRLIGSRIRYALDLLERSTDTTHLVLRSGVGMDKGAIADFLRIVQLSVFEKNKKIAQFIEAICFGNMRMALEMFATFLTSGATDVDKMLTIYHRDGAYYVAFHEFLKSIMLRDRYYYKESQSQIMNLFDCGADKNSSHFTSLRLLRLFLSHRGESTKEGQGYFEIAQAVSIFEDVFDNREDFIRCMNRLVDHQLIETNTRSTETIKGASHARVTSAGWYYHRFLAKEFSYLDLVLQDTPLSDSAVERELRMSVYRVNNLSDREEEKLVRTEARFERVERFIDYLDNEEQQENARYGLTRLDNIIADSIVPNIRSQFHDQKEWIARRLRENREKYAEELLPDVPDEEKELLPILDEDDPQETIPGV